ncbi:MAG TPA: CHASE domain-containing protein [Tahibacter sp.]|uniref:CHASE domain-containing protein n=1 Tax=Tahibacter sp. TaxID=2056211 RepID=UPI002C9AF15C|nr:CHASE domain-containing protein [Tahibacter sp.]HSX61871.1 CHASE domain-containing protein [Tahibacter sp.]
MSESATPAPAPEPGRLLAAGAAATGACVLVGVALNRFGPAAWAPSWTALGALLLLAAGLLAERARRPRLVAVLCAPVAILGVFMLAAALAGTDARAHVLLPNNSAAGLLAAAVSLACGIGKPRSAVLLIASVLAALALALGAFGVFGRLAGITPGVGWGSVDSVSFVTGAGLIACGATLLIARARSRDGDDVALRASLLPALFVLAVALGATAMAWRVSADAATRAQRQRLEREVDQLAVAIEARLRGHLDLLRGAQGLFAASDRVEPDEWRRYWDRIDVPAQFPGIAGVGFAPRIAARSRSDFEGALAARLRPGFRIWPESDREALYPVSFLEPGQGANLKLVGFDLGSDPARRAALERAIALDDVALSGTLSVGGRVDGSSVPGFALYVPLHPGRRDDDPDGGMVGVAYFEFRVGEWMQPIVAEARRDLQIRLHDGDGTGEAPPFYTGGNGAALPLRHERTIALGGRNWLLSGSATPAFMAANASLVPLSILLVGLFCSLLLFAITWLLADLRTRAERLAARRTRELERSRQAFQALTDTASDAIIAADADGNIRYVNRAVEGCFGYTSDELLRQPLTVLMPERYRDAHLNGLARFLAGGEPRVIGRAVEVAGLHRDGSEFPLEISIGHWRSDGEHHFTAILRDITRRREIEEALLSQRKELERSNGDLEQFAYVASHDLQEPLRMVASYVQLLSRRYKGRLDADADDFIGFAVDGALRMQRLIDDLLAYSRIGSRGEKQRNVAAVDCLQAALRNLAARIEETRADIRFGELPIVHVDPAQFTQLLQNLIANALKFNGDARPEIHIDAEREGECWHFRVRDNGIGIDPQYAERIFVIFQRLHTRQHYQGTGIGLAICKKIVERAGGRIWVESRLGQGATFHFTVPVMEQDS